MKLNFRKSLTYPKITRSYKLHPIPATSIEAQKAAKTENRWIFLTAYTKIAIIAVKENIIKNTLEFSRILKAAPVFCTKIKSINGFSGVLNLSVSSNKAEKYKSKMTKNTAEIKKYTISSPQLRPWLFYKSSKEVLTYFHFCDILPTRTYVLFINILNQSIIFYG